MKNHYETLNVEAEASPKEILKAYEKLKFMYSKNIISADTLFEGEEENLLEEIKESYLVLSDPIKRSEYNRENNIQQTRDIIRYNFDAPKYLDSSIIEIPKFAKTDDTLYTEKLNNINKSRLKAKGLAVPKYKVDLEKENTIKQETKYDGNFLKFVREYKNMSYQFIASRIKFNASYVEKIEQELFEELPAKVYIKGFLKVYAKLLNLPIDDVLNGYMSRAGHSGTDSLQA